MKNVIVLVRTVLIIISLNSCQSQEEGENPEESYLAEVQIDDSLHLAHAGEITFMKEYVSVNDYAPSDMISSIDIPYGNTEDANLLIRVYLANTLTNYLKELDTTATISDLVRNGNYQFSFTVDGQLIYTEDLNSGAGSPSSKNRNTSLCVPLYSKDNADSWGRFMWSRFLHRNGGQEVLNVGSHRLKLEIRPYLKIDKKKVGDIIASGEITLNIIDDSVEIDEALLAISPITPSNGFDIGIDEVKLDMIKALKSKILNKTHKKVTSVVVIKDQKLVLEEYFADSDRSVLNDARSVGKSITSTLVGIAIDKKYLKNVDQKLSEFYNLKEYNNFSALKAEITIKDLLTMTSSFDGSDEDAESKGGENYVQQGENWMKAAMDLPAIDKPQKEWTYFTMGTMILGDILNKVTPDGLEQFAKQNLFDPMGIDQIKWFRTPNGLPYGGGGLQLTSLDLAKIGSLYTNDGVWNGQQIVTADWIERSTSAQINMPTGRGDSFGYLWYNDTFVVDGKTYDVSFAAGNGGNFIYVIDELDIVVVITAKAYNTIEGGTQGPKMMKEYLLPAII